MHVQFEFTQDDVIGASERFSARSKVVRSWRWKGLISSAFMAWLLVFAIFFTAPLKGMIAGLIGALIAVLIYPTMHKRGVEKRMRSLLREKLGNTSSFTCEVELTPVGVWVRQLNKQVMHEWESVEEIIEGED